MSSFLNRLKEIVRSNIPSGSNPSPIYKDQEISSSQPKVNIDPKAKEYFSNLELPYGASLSEVKHNYRKLMQKYHPDLHAQDATKSATALTITKQLNAAITYLEANYYKNIHPQRSEP